jgi:hypothetical protein
MAQRSSRQRNQVKGAFFEVIVKKLLRRAGYEPISPDEVHIRSSDGHVRGRGYWHDIDALGRYAYPLFYMYPIRLLAEVKCYKDDVPIWAVRNFVGALKDISENYFVDDRMNRDQMLAYTRYTDCGSFFSASGFTIGAQKYALAQGVFLISYENNPILSDSVNTMNSIIDLLDVPSASKEESSFCNWVSEALDDLPQNTYASKFVPTHNQGNFSREFNRLHVKLNSIQTSAIAMLVGKDPALQYPIHVLSNQKMPERTFATTDDHLFRVFYEETRRGLSFEVVPTEAEEWRLQFSLPQHIYGRYFAEGKMLDFKNRYIQHIELPLTIQGMRRILRLNLDPEWRARLRLLDPNLG